ncbi:bis(5'nucleosyl)-tetraphosphatase ApaH [Mesocricetibacter intestinalis]|uniref:Bis(5'-nucleosyl)-tetraphosphatase, symmetrical n=1 Tax=Mesocricetibacter intestinalis TaxID=1521930 RepID=A0A4R6V8C6_9PAST|nr:bis(5'-nucleosyl)-tetraphosphatase (symmetrical) ApaH [Mesocricetibacter intestinalis]TDQ57952.1 bis(5'nucleosyl)-tetraphosphatase ApaH [Mesocricetibacter intestinalis]
MATYLVGDLQGCYDELRSLLDRVKFDPASDHLYLVGDLVARGDKSLDCLRLVKSLGAAAQTVLGNHDLHLIATALGIKKVKACDRVEGIFAAADFEALIDWLRRQPLLVYNRQRNFVMTHAGISPDWDLSCALACAAEVENVLRGDDYHELLRAMYQNYPERWNENLSGFERLRYIINVFTRMRFCYRDHRLDFACKAPPEQAPPELLPWFKLENPLYKQLNIVFGHWASLVDTPTPENIYALDTGCVWNNRLTMLRWEDKRYFVQPALKDYRWA